jgi:outer membrane lipoprotein-sorting protein
MKYIFLTLLVICSITACFSQAADKLVEEVKAKLDKVNDYVAEGHMKTDVAFIKAPAGKIKVYYKKPDRITIQRDGGISILPKGGVSVNMGSLLSQGDFSVIPTGEGMVNGSKVSIVRLLPQNQDSDVVLTTLYIDASKLLILKASTTTRENGTFEIEMKYGKYAAYGLPDVVVFSFNAKDYKIPKGLTMEFETGEKMDVNKLKNKKGRVEITYTNYLINRGVADAVFN